MNDKVLVTGGAGFIGSHLSEFLVKQGYDVKILDQYNSLGFKGWFDNINPELKNSIEYFAADIRDPDAVKAAMQGCKKVFHLAALISIPYSYIAPKSYVDTNLLGTLNVLNCARDLGVERVVNTSTSEIYGTAKYVPIDEKHPVQGQSPYSASKIGADQIAYSYYCSYSLPVVTLRPFNTYGPRQSSRAIIPTIITQILSGVKEIKLGNLSPTRDFSFVTDTARAFFEISNVDKAVGEVVNVGSEFEISMAEVVDLLFDSMKVYGAELITEQDRVRPEKSEVMRLFACTKKAKGLWDWKPNYGGYDGFKKGLQETIEWFSDPVNLAHYKDLSYRV